MSHSQLIISRSNLLNNYKYFRSKLKENTKMLILVKANGYGHGDVEISKLVEEFGADYLGVAFPCEGIRLKRAGIKLPILILTPGYNNFEEIVNENLEPSIIDMEALENLDLHLKKCGKSKFPVHLKFNSGMNRVGFCEDDLPQLKEFFSNQERINVKSVFSHLAAADENVHDDFTLGQIRKFEKFYENVTTLLGYKPIKHILNSSGIERFPEYQFDMVRLGIGLYGTSCTKGANLLPVSYLKAPVVQVKEVQEGTVGYGRKGTLNGVVKKIATVPLGYADGIDRHLSRGNTSFMINGRLAPTIGNVCMDMFMLDVTGIDVKPGDEVTIFGDNPSAIELAAILGTISYEIFTSVSARVQRVVAG